MKEKEKEKEEKFKGYQMEVEELFREMDSEEAKLIEKCPPDSTSPVLVEPEILERLGYLSNRIENLLEKMMED